MVELIRESGQDHLLGEAYDRCLQGEGDHNPTNHLQVLYNLFTDEQISAKITDIVRPKGMQAELEVVCRSPDHTDRRFHLHRRKSVR